MLKCLTNPNNPRPDQVDGFRGSRCCSPLRSTETITVFCKQFKSILVVDLKHRKYTSKCLNNLQNVTKFSQTRQTLLQEQTEYYRQCNAIQR